MQPREVPTRTTRTTRTMAKRVKSGDFRAFEVRSREPLRKLLERSKIKLEKGKAFYQMTKVGGKMDVINQI